MGGYWDKIFPEHYCILNKYSVFRPKPKGTSFTQAMAIYCGRICLHRKKISLSTVFAGQAVDSKEVEEGIWLVSFMDYDLGYIDLEEKTLQPLKNPFGPKL
jgi:hypothetical protein